MGSSGCMIFGQLLRPEASHWMMLAIDSIFQCRFWLNGCLIGKQVQTTYSMHGEEDFVRNAALRNGKAYENENKNDNDNYSEWHHIQKPALRYR